MTRAEQMRKGQIWQVTHDDDPDTVLFEGRMTAAYAVAVKTWGRHWWRMGVHVGRLIWEEQTEKGTKV